MRIKDTLIGFGDFYDGSVVGAADRGYGSEIGASPAASAARGAASKGALAKGVASRVNVSSSQLSAAKGAVKAVKAKRAVKRPSPHLHSMGTTALSGKNAIDVAKKVGMGVVSYKQAVRGGKLANPVKIAVFAKRAMIGAAVVASTGRPMTPKQQAAVTRHAAAAARLSFAHKAALAAAKNANAKGKAALDFVSKNAPALKVFQKTGKRLGSTAHVGALLDQVEAMGGIGALSDDEVVGLAQALMGQDAAPPDASGSGTDTSGDTGVPSDTGAPAPTPTDSALASSGPGGLDKSTGIVTAPDGSVLYDPSQDPDVLPLPVRGGMLSQEDALIPANFSVPEDGVIYDGTYGGPDVADRPAASNAAARDGFGSAGGFYNWSDANSGGGIDTQAALAMAFTGGAAGQDPWAKHAGPPGQHNMYRWGESKWMYFSGGPDGDLTDATEKTTAAVNTASLGRNWGPLIGNPTNPNFAGLQYSIPDNKFFWQGPNAPKWATQGADMKITEANKKTIAANQAAALAQVKQMVADALAAKEAQAKQDAENALAESAAASQARIATAAEEPKQAQAETAAQQAIVAQQQADTAQQQMQAEQDKQAGVILMSQAQQQQEQDKQITDLLIAQAKLEQAQGISTAPAGAPEEGAPEAGDEGDYADQGEPPSDDEVLSDAIDEGSQDDSSQGDEGF